MNKTAIITGAYGAIGRGITEGMAEAGFNLILVGRSENRLEQLATYFQNTHHDINVKYNCVDLSTETEIFWFANQLSGSVDVLINNAATCPRYRTETREDIEMQFATNVLGYFWMMKYLASKMKAGSRIVNVASYWAGGLDLSDIEFKTRNYDNDAAYRQSKQANRMLSSYFAVLLSCKGITVNACHPGDVNSKLSNDLGFGGHESPRRGAETPVWLATSDEIKNISGKYFEHKKEISCQFSANAELNEKIYTLCSGYCKSDPEI